MAAEAVSDACISVMIHVLLSSIALLVHWKDIKSRGYLLDWFQYRDGAGCCPFTSRLRADIAMSETGFILKW